MATEISDLNVIQDEDTLRRMWQQTEDFGRKKEIRLRMYRLREERLKSYYITRETTDGTTVTDRKSTTASHAESLNDRGFLTMKTKEIRDSASPTLDMKQICHVNNSNANQTSQISEGTRQFSISPYAGDQVPQHEESFSVHVHDDTKNKNSTKSSHYTTSSSSHWETSEKSSNVEYSHKFDKSSTNAAATTATTTATPAALDYKITRSEDVSNNDYRVNENTTKQSYDHVDTRENSRQNMAETSTLNQNVSKNYVTEIHAPVRHETADTNNHFVENKSQFETRTTENDDRIRNNVSGTSSKTAEESTRVSSTNSHHTIRNIKTTTEDVTNVNKSIMNELRKLDSYLSTEAVTESAAPPSQSGYPADERSIYSAKAETDHVTTYQQTSTNKISQDVSATHNAFASSLRASPTPSSKRSSSKSSLERSSPEKTPRVSPEKCPSYATNDLSKKFTASFQHRISNRYEKKSDDSRRRTSTSECDSDDSSATYKKQDRTCSSTSSRRIDVTTRHSVNRTKNREHSSEGSVEREIKNRYSKSPDSSPERKSAFKTVSTTQAERFQTEIRRQSFPQTPDHNHTQQKTQKRKIQSEDRSYSEKHNVRQSPEKVDKTTYSRTDSEKTRKVGKYTRQEDNATKVKVNETKPRTQSPTKPARVTSPAKSSEKRNRPFDGVSEYTSSYTSPTSPTKLGRATSPVKPSDRGSRPFNDISEYTCSYTSPNKSRTHSPEKMPYDYTSIRPNRGSSTSPTKESPISLTKMESPYRAPSQSPTKFERTPSPVKRTVVSDQRKSASPTKEIIVSSTKVQPSYHTHNHSPTKFERTPSPVNQPVASGPRKSASPAPEIIFTSTKVEPSYRAHSQSPTKFERTSSPVKQPVASDQRKSTSPATEIVFTSTIVEPSYRAPSQSPTNLERTKKPSTSGHRSSDQSVPGESKKSVSASETPFQKIEIRKSATSPPKTSTLKTTKPKQPKEESESESSESSSSSDESDADGNSVTIEEIIENHELDKTGNSTLDELIKTDDEVEKDNSEKVDEFDFVKEEKTTLDKTKTTTNANEEFLRQEKIIKEGEIDGSIPPAEVVLGKEAAKLLHDDFIAKEKDSSTMDGKRKDGRAKDKAPIETPTKKATEKKTDKTKPGTENQKAEEKQVARKTMTIQTTDSKSPSRKYVSPQKINVPKEEYSKKPKSTTFENESKKRQPTNDITRKNVEDQPKKAAHTKIVTKLTRKDSKNISPEKPETKMNGQPDRNATNKKNAIILTKRKSDKDVYRKEAPKQYRRAESERTVKTADVTTKTSLSDITRDTIAKKTRGDEKVEIRVNTQGTLRKPKQIIGRSKTDTVDEKSTGRNEKTNSKTLTKKISGTTVQNERKTNVETPKTYKTVLAVAVPRARPSSTPSPLKNIPKSTTTPVNGIARKSATRPTTDVPGTKTKDSKETVVKTRTIYQTESTAITPTTSTRPRKDTPKPQQITIKVCNKLDSTKPKTVSQQTKQSLKKILAEASSSSSSSNSSSSLDLIDVEEGETETIDVTKTRSKEITHQLAAADAQHLNVIVRMPSSSRETTPKLNADDEFCTVTDDGGHPRYADRVLEPEDVETVKRITIPRFEKITDLDDEDERGGEEETENVSVADRVSKFLENTKDIRPTTRNKETSTKQTVDQVFQNQAVHKTKEIFETIAKNSKPPPIVNRPSVFEQKRLRESIKEEEETDSTATGHDNNQHKIVSKKLTQKDHDDYIAERESTTLVEPTQVSTKIPSKTDTYDGFTSHENVSHCTATDSSTTRSAKNFAQTEKEEMEKESAIHDEIETNQTRQTKEKSESNIATTYDEKRKSTATAEFDIKQNKPTSPTRSQPEQRPSKPQPKETWSTKIECKIDTTKDTSDVKPTDKRSRSPTVTNPSPKSPDTSTSPTRKQPSPVRTTAEKDDTTRKSVQRYDSRKTSCDKVSLQPMEIVTIEVKPSKRIFDHTAITTVNAYDYDTHNTQQRTTSRKSPSRCEKSPLPSERLSPSKADSVTVSTAKLEKRLSTTAKDYQNRKQFFENKTHQETSKTTRRELSNNEIEKNVRKCDTSERDRVNSTSRKSPQRKVAEKPASRKSSPEKETPTTQVSTKRKSPEKIIRPTPFGVTLKKTASVTNSNTNSKTQNQITSVDSEEISNIEKIFDIALLEIMLEKAVRYDVRSRIRAQIRLIRRQTELNKSSEKSPVREIKRASTSPPKTSNISETNQISLQRRDKVKKRLFTDQSAQRKVDERTRLQHKTTPIDDRNFRTNQRNSPTCKTPVFENGQETETTYRKDYCTSAVNDSETKSTITRSIISGYGVGPTDENGKPLFGLKALRTSSDEKSSTAYGRDKIASKVDDTNEITDTAGRPLFGLKALQRKHDMETESSKTLVNQYRNDVTDGQFRSRSSNDDTSTTTSSTTTTMYSSRTAMKSDGSGNMSILRDEVKGEIRANNGQQPTGKMTRNRLSYEKPRDSEAIVRTTTTTRTLNSKDKENQNRNQNYTDSNTRQRVDDDGYKSKFGSSSLIRKISNEHFEKAHRKFSGDDGTSESRRDSFEKYDSKRDKSFSKSDSKEKFASNYSYEQAGEHSQSESSFDHSDDFQSQSQISRNNSFKEIKSKFQQATVSSSMKQVTRSSDDGESYSYATVRTDSAQRPSTQHAKNQSDFFDQGSKLSNNFSFSKFSESTNNEGVERVQGTRSELTRGEKEAVTLLNKFVGGGSVSLQELEVIPSTNDGAVFSNKAVSLANKLHQNKTKQNTEFDIDQIWDEEELRNLLEACTDYEKRRLIRSRLRAIMADRKGCTDLISATTSDSADKTQTTNGECYLPTAQRSQSSPSSMIEDSGTESGEDLRLLNPELLAEVRGALAKLESALPTLDTARRASIIPLVTKLQSCLKVSETPTVSQNTSPRRQCKDRKSRHTVGVSKEELADARKWLAENFLEPPQKPVQSSTNSIPMKYESNKVYKPVKFTPIPPKENRKQKLTVAQHHPQPSDPQKPVVADKPKPFSGSLGCTTNGASQSQNYDRVVKFDGNAFNKQYAEEQLKKENFSSDEGDVSSTEEEAPRVDSGSPTPNSYSSAGKFGNEIYKKIPSRFQRKNNKTVRMKRANTIDLPKLINCENITSSGDDECAYKSADEKRIATIDPVKKPPPPKLELKTDKDKKFAAFLEQTKQEDLQTKTVTYNPSAAGGAQWSNRFSHIKTAFEAPKVCSSPEEMSQKLFKAARKTATFPKQSQPAPTPPPFTHAHQSPFKPITKVAPFHSTSPIVQNGKPFKLGLGEQPRTPKTYYSPVKNAQRGNAGDIVKPSFYYTNPTYTPKPEYYKRPTVPAHYSKPEYFLNEPSTYLHVPNYNSTISQPASPSIPIASPSPTLLPYPYLSLPTSPSNENQQHWKPVEFSEERVAVAKIMGKPQQAVVVANNKTNYRDASNASHKTDFHSKNTYQKLAQKSPMLQNFTQTLAKIPQKPFSVAQPIRTPPAKKQVKILQLNDSEENLPEQFFVMNQRNKFENMSAKGTQPMPPQINEKAFFKPLSTTPHNVPKKKDSPPPLVIQQSRSPPQSPIIMPSVLQKSESWHQMIMEKMKQAKPPSPIRHKIPRAKSTHNLASMPKQYEPTFTPENITIKQQTVQQFLSKDKQSGTRSPQAPSQSVANKKLNEDFKHVDEAFEILFKEASAKLM